MAPQRTPRYPIPASRIAVETVVVNSRFVCTVSEARSVDAALDVIRDVKSGRADASSHAWAYRIGHGSSVIDGCNDGGEPGGTAGRPMLAVLQGSGLGDTVAVVSRYFGGTLLGTGGLVRAFGGALKAALEALPRTVRVERIRCLVEVPYPLFERVRLLVAAHEGEILQTEFDQAALLTCRFIADDVPGFELALTELSGGSTIVLPLDIEF
jgi:uncharacterized YigZ family protein